MIPSKCDEILTGGALERNLFVVLSMAVPIQKSPLDMQEAITATSEDDAETSKKSKKKRKSQSERSSSSLDV